MRYSPMDQKKAAMVISRVVLLRLSSLIILLYLFDAEETEAFQASLFYDNVNHGLSSKTVSLPFRFNRDYSRSSAIQAVVSPPKNGGTHPWSSSTRMMMIPDPYASNDVVVGSVVVPSSIITSAVEVFDGSTISNPVVYSNAYWINLKNQLVPYLIAQFLAGIVFVVVVSSASKQIQKFVEESSFLSSGFFAKMDPRLSQQSPDIPKLAISILIDSIGYSALQIGGPILGEISDVIWAPIAALTLRSLYGSNVVFLLEFLEELFPFTDIIPLATICWIVDTFFSETSLSRTLQIGKYSPTGAFIMNNKNDDNNTEPTDVGSKQ